MSRSLSAGMSRPTRVLGRLVALAFIATSVAAVALTSPVSAAPRRGLLPNSPVSGGVLMARALRSGAVRLPGLTPTRGGFLALAPDVTVLPNVKASAGNQPVNETPIAANPSNGMQLETGGNDYNCASFLGFYNSNNGGATWRRHCMPVTGAGGCGDPNVAYNLNNTAYILGIGNCNGSTGSIVFQKSTNNGVTWSAAKVAFGSLLGGLPDKPWTEIDTNPASPHKNCIYVSWTDFNASFTKTRASVAHSCNGGTTWTRVPVDVTRTVPKIDQFTDLAIGPDGTVYLTWQFCKVAGPVNGNCAATAVDMKFSKSIDGGNTWSPAVVMATVQTSPDTCGGYYGCFPGSSERLANIPVIDINKGNGSLHSAFYRFTGGKVRALETHSTNGGNAWSAPVGVLSKPGNQGFIWLAVSGSGTIGVSFFSSKTNGRYVENASFSFNNGNTWPTSAKLSSATALFANDGFGGGFIGDYTGGIWVGATLHTSWSDARTNPSVDMTGGATP